MPVFRTSTASHDAHLWATWSGIVGVQLLDDAGRCFADTTISLKPPSGTHALTTDATGIAWIRERSDGPQSLKLPEDLLLPHPRDTVAVPDARTTADVKTARANVVALRSGSITRLRVQPLEAAPGYISCHFDEGSVYPADTLIALVQQARDALEIDPNARLGLFSHTRASGSVDDDKALSDRRARFVHAVLTADLAALQSVVDDDAWEDTHYVSVAHFLGYQAAEPRDLFASFQWGYSAGHHHAPELGLGEGQLEATGNLDARTQHALLDAFLASVGTSLPGDAFASTPCMGCGSFNEAPAGDHPDRLSLAVFPAGRVPGSVPCVPGDAAACHVESDGGCRFFAERVAETSLQYRWLEGPPRDDDDLLYMGARVLVHQGARVATAVYNAPARAEVVTYAFNAPTNNGAPLGLAPRVHLSRPKDKLGARLNQARRIRADATPDGDYIRPVAWNDADAGQPIDEILNRFWSHTLSVITKNSILLDTPDVHTYRQLLDDALVKDQLPILPEGKAFDAYRLLTRAEFLRYFLLAGMVAAGQVLNPLQSTRYASNFGKATFACNIYAGDLVDLLPQGAWLPKVQFTHPGRVRRKLSRAKTEPVSAVGPSGVNDFLNGRFGVGGSDYGWNKLEGDPTTRGGRRAIRDDAQALANRGVLVVLSGAGTPDVIGHAAVVMPDLAFLSEAERSALIYPQVPTTTGLAHHVWGFETSETELERHAPMRSQAGGFNRHGTRLGSLVLIGKEKFRTPGYFQYDPKTDKSRGTDVVRELTGRG